MGTGISSACLTPLLHEFAHTIGIPVKPGSATGKPSSKRAPGGPVGSWYASGTRPKGNSGRAAGKQVFLPQCHEVTSLDITLCLSQPSQGYTNPFLHQQQDASEFLAFLLNAAHDELVAIQLAAQQVLHLTSCGRLEGPLLTHSLL